MPRRLRHTAAAAAVDDKQALVPSSHPDARLGLWGYSS